MESKYTKAERREIYLKAADLIKEGPGFMGCVAITNASDDRKGGDEDNFPEFHLFKPTLKKREGVFGWWAPMEKEPRIIALLISAEMCKD